MKTLLSEVFTNGNASKAFWTIITAAILGGAGWLTTLNAQVQRIESQQILQTEKNKDVKEDIHEVKEDLKEIKKLVIQIARKQ